MTSLESTACPSNASTRVVVVAASRRLDLAVPSDIALLDLLPTILHRIGVREHEKPWQAWHLGSTGHGRLDLGRTLRSCAVLDGDVLRLVPDELCIDDPDDLTHDLTHDVFDDVLDDVVDASARAAHGRSPTDSLQPLIGAATLVLALTAAALTMMLSAWSSASSAASPTPGASASRDASAALLACVAGATGALLAARLLVRRELTTLGVAAVSGGVLLAFAVGAQCHFGAGGAHAQVLAGCAAVLIYCLVGGLAVRPALAVLTAGSTCAGFIAFATATHWLVPTSLPGDVAAATALAVLAAPALPRLAVHMARLPSVAGVGPGSGPDGTDRQPHPFGGSADVSADGTADLLAARAACAARHLTGLHWGCALVIAAGAVFVGLSPGPLAAAFAVTALAVTARRAGHAGAWNARAVGLTVTSAGLVVLVVLRGVIGGATVGAVVATELAIAATTVAALTLRVGPSPIIARLLDQLEFLAAVGMLPLAVSIAHIYGTMPNV